MLVQLCCQTRCFQRLAIGDASLELQSNSSQAETVYLAQSLHFSKGPFQVSFTIFPCLIFTNSEQYLPPLKLTMYLPIQHFRKHTSIENNNRITNMSHCRTFIHGNKTNSTKVVLSIKLYFLFQNSIPKFYGLIHIFV